MCNERRADVSKIIVDPAKPEPHVVWSVNLTATRFYLSLLLAVCALVGIMLGGLRAAEGYMTSTADARFRSRISQELQPGGQIEDHTSDAIREHQAQTEIDLERRLLRLELLMEALYEDVTGRPAPDTDS